MGQSSFAAATAQRDLLVSQAAERCRISENSVGTATGRGPGFPTLVLPQLPVSRPPHGGLSQPEALSQVGRGVKWGAVSSGPGYEAPQTIEGA